MTKLKLRLFIVRVGRAVHWPKNRGRPEIWARAGDVLDLTSDALLSIIQETGQAHKITPIDGVPKGAKVIAGESAPNKYRKQIQDFEKSGNCPDGVTALMEPEASEYPTIDLAPLAPDPEEAPPKKGEGAKSGGKAGAGKKEADGEG